MTSFDEEMAELRAEIEQLRRRCDVLNATNDQTKEMLGRALIRAGKMEEQRNRARQRYGEAKRRWRQRERDRLPPGARLIGTEYIAEGGHILHYTTKPKTE